MANTVLETQGRPSAQPFPTFVASSTPLPISLFSDSLSTTPSSTLHISSSGIVIATPSFNGSFKGLLATASVGLPSVARPRLSYSQYGRTNSTLRSESAYASFSSAPLQNKTLSFKFREKKQSLSPRMAGTDIFGTIDTSKPQIPSRGDHPVPRLGIVSVCSKAVHPQLGDRKFPCTAHPANTPPT